MNSQNIEAWLLSGDKAVVALIGLMAWIIKNVIVSAYKKRQEALIQELTYRLREVYNPLLLWSGVVQFKGRAGEDKLGVREVTKSLEKAGNLLPLKVYHVFVRLLEHATGQSTTPPSVHAYQQAKAYLYSKIEITNFVLYRITGIDDIAKHVDPLLALKQAARLGLNGLIQITLWIGIVVVLYGFYKLVWGNTAAMLFFALLLILLVTVEIQRRFAIYAEVKKNLSSQI